MNISKGLKRIINVPFWLWIIIGIIFLFNNFDEILMWAIFGLATPIFLRYAIFYIIDGFFD